MKIILVGCGKVGYTLAEQLNNEGHELTIIDTNDDKVQSVGNRLDVICIPGNGTSYRVQLEAGVKEADLLIAVTNQDEINLLCCLIAKKAGNCQTIARVRNPEYYQEINFIKEELGLSMAINPELAAASNIAHLIQVPSAMDIDTFVKGKVNLVRFKIPDGSSWNGIKVSEAANRVGYGMLICIVESNHEIYIPFGDTVLREGDNISVIIPPSRLNTLFTSIGIKGKIIRNVMIAGGGTIAYYLARRLIESRINVKIIETNRSRCEQLSDLLPKAMIIYGDASNASILKEEGITQTDAFVALTDYDEENIMLALYGQKVSDAKMITKINKISYDEDILEELPIGSVVSPKFLTAEHIIQYVRSMQNSLGSNVRAVYRLMDNKVEALEFFVREKSAVTGVPLMELELKKNLLLCSIVRRGKIIIPSGQDKIQEKDTVIVVTTHIGLKKIEEILA